MIDMILGFDFKQINNTKSNIEYQQFDKNNKQLKFSLRSVAFLAVVFSTFAITACLFTFPFIFHYVQQLQAHVQVN